MRPYLTTLLAASVSTLAFGQVDLTAGDIDVGINYDLVDGWDLHIHDEVNDVEYEPDEARFVGLFPDAGPFVFSQFNAPFQPFVGIGTEELASGIFVNDEVMLTLTSVSGPGSFRLTQAGTFGGLTILMDSSDGFGSDSIVRLADTHEHFNWEFTAPGTYVLGFTASGTLTAGSVFTTSDEALYTFVANVPEPASLALLALGGAAMLRRRNTA